VIRVNLLRNMSTGALATGMPTMAAPMVSQDLQKQGAIRLVVIVACIGTVIAYEKIQLSAKQDELTKVQAQVSEVRTKRESLGDTGPIVEKFQAQEAVLNRKIKTLEQITSNRLREVKLLDAVQSILPSQTWLEKLSIDQGKVEMVGFATDQAIVSQIFTQVDGNVLFSDVKPPRTELQVTTGSSTPLMRFEFLFFTGKAGQ